MIFGFIYHTRVFIKKSDFQERTEPNTTLVWFGLQKMKILFSVYSVRFGSGPNGSIRFDLISDRMDRILSPRYIPYVNRIPTTLNTNSI